MSKQKCLFVCRTRRIQIISLLEFLAGCKLVAKTVNYFRLKFFFVNVKTQVFVYDVKSYNDYGIVVELPRHTQQTQSAEPGFFCF